MGVSTGVPIPTSSVTLLSPSFVTHTLPDASRATPNGALKLAATKPFEPERKLPAGPISVIALLPRFVTHTLPAASIAIPLGKLRPPPVKPPVPESGRPAGLNLDTPVLLLAAQALP